MNEKKLNFWKYMTYKMLSINSSFVFPLEFFFKHNIKLDKQKVSKYLDIKNKWLYIHIPFCIKICDYCGCYKQKLTKDDDLNKYVEYLVRELELYYELNNNKKLVFTTIMFWWWTASILSAEQLDYLFSWIFKYIDKSYLKQLSFEASIFTLSNDKINVLKSYWVDRISIWIQSFDKNVLEKNNRIYIEYRKIKQIIDYIKLSWILVQIDLMVWIKWQDEVSCIKDFKKMLDLWVDSYTMNYYIPHSFANFSDTKRSIDLKETIKKLDKKYNFKTKNNNSYLLQEELVFNDFNYFVIWLGVWATTNIANRFIYRKTDFNNYYNHIKNKLLIVDEAIEMSNKFAAIKYIFEKYKETEFDLKDFKKQFWVKLKDYFPYEIDFLIKENIIKLESDKVVFLKNKYESRIYLNIFLEDLFETKKDIDIPVLDKQFHIDLMWLIYE